MFPTETSIDRPWEGVCEKFIEHGQQLKTKHAIFTIKWMQYGKKIITGHTNGEIHIWNGVTLKFDSTVHQQHWDRINVMKWVWDEQWLITGDKWGKIVIWDNKLSDLVSIEAH